MIGRTNADIGSAACAFFSPMLGNTLLLQKAFQRVHSRKALPCMELQYWSHWVGVQPVGPGRLIVAK